MAGMDSKAKKEYRFYILRPGDGRYVFKCSSSQQRDDWTMSLNKVITVSVYNTCIMMYTIDWMILALGVQQLTHKTHHGLSMNIRCLVVLFCGYLVIMT